MAIHEDQGLFQACLPQETGMESPSDEHREAIARFSEKTTPGKSRRHKRRRRTHFDLSWFG